MFNKSEKEIKKIDKDMESVESNIRQKLYELGCLYFEANKEMDTPYKDKIDGIKQLEADKKVLYHQKLAIQGLMQCESCGTVISGESTFCNKCGQRVKADIVENNKKQCAFCGTTIEEGMKFCVNCGKPVEEGEDKNEM